MDKNISRISFLLSGVLSIILAILSIIYISERMDIKFIVLSKYENADGHYLKLERHDKSIHRLLVTEKTFEDAIVGNSITFTLQRQDIQEVGEYALIVALGSILGTVMLCYLLQKYLNK